MKKCPYCAEKIQDGAIVCKHCGRDLPHEPINNNQANPETQPSRKNLPKAVVFIPLGVVLCFVGLVVFGLIYNTTPEGKVALTERAAKRALLTASAPTKTSTPAPSATTAPTATIVLSATTAPSATVSPTATLAPTATFTPTNTPLPMIGMDLSQWVKEYDSMTDLQKKDFVDQSIGKWVEWSGEVSEITEDGTIFLDMPDTLLSLVYLDGVPVDVGIKLTKGQRIQYTGRIEKISDFLGLRIYVENGKILP